MNRTVQRHRGAVTVEFPLRTTNPNNGAIGMSRNAAFAKARARKAQRQTARAHVLGARPLPCLPVRVLVTRIAPSNGLDPHDGLGAALKGVIDGIADALGLDNDRDPRVTWELAQRRGPPRAYGVEIRIERVEVTVATAAEDAPGTRRSAKATPVAGGSSEARGATAPRRQPAPEPPSGVLLAGE